MGFSANPWNIESVLNYFANTPAKDWAVSQVTKVGDARKAERLRVNARKSLAGNPVGETVFRELVDNIFKFASEVHPHAVRLREIYPVGSENMIAKYVVLQCELVNYENKKNLSAFWDFFHIPSTNIPFGTGFDDIAQASSMMEALIRIADAQAADDNHSSPPEMWSPVACKRHEDALQLAKLENELKIGVKKDGANGASKSKSKRKVSAALTNNNANSAKPSEKKQKKPLEITIDLAGSDASNDTNSADSSDSEHPLPQKTSARNKPPPPPSLDAKICDYLDVSTKSDLAQYYAAHPEAQVWDMLCDKKYHRDRKGRDMRKLLAQFGCFTADEVPVMLEDAARNTAVRNALLEVPAGVVLKLFPESAMVAQVTPRDRVPVNHAFGH